jgi:hypothetical protein
MGGGAIEIMYISLGMQKRDHCNNYYNGWLTGFLIIKICEKHEENLYDKS